MWGKTQAWNSFWIYKGINLIKIEIKINGKKIARSSFLAVISWTTNILPYRRQKFSKGTEWEKKQTWNKKSCHILRVGPFLSRNLREHGQFSLKNEGRNFHKELYKKKQQQERFRRPYNEHSYQVWFHLAL